MSLAQGETVPYIICVERSPAASTPGPADADGSAAAGTPLRNGASADGVPAGTPGAGAAAGAGASAGGGSGGGGIAERAHHPDELRESGGRLAVDVEYYLAQQV